ncbi:hypothetical protein FGO68_gene4617 [Halteria grandinella]|uniref:Fructose-1-6-bisphosphatase class 1 C-terminal domain-containing protein n=1 Tax=Halteria grandinella TaxID=5974 RepID=A0A8J8T1X4_HALGN|nr:hypothetical protein FGO68_gene4617 [Halteria grandinella]
MLESVAHPFLIEKAGGTTSDGRDRSVLETPVAGFKQRSSFVAGSSADVEFIINTVREGEAKEQERLSGAGKTVVAV